jgi:hypothetical protein
LYDILTIWYFLSIIQGVLAIMINNSNNSRWDRLSAKNLDQQFLGEMLHGLNCSRFEALAILDKVHQVFNPLFENSGTIKPGQIQLIVVSSDVAPNVPLAEAKQQMVTLTFDSGAEDLEIRKEQGVVGLRRARMQRMAIEAFQQGGLMTIEDFAYRVFNCGVRTLLGDLAALRDQDIVVPLRSTVKDMGRAITHRKLIIELWLQGKEYSEIARASFHSVEAVYNYVDKFKRSITLMQEGFDINTTGFLVKVSPKLAEEFLRIYKDADIVEHRRREIEECIKKNNCTGEYERI